MILSRNTLVEFLHAFGMSVHLLIRQQGETLVFRVREMRRDEPSSDMYGVSTT